MQLFQIEAHQRTYKNPDIRFWAGPTEIMDRAEAEAQIGGFIEKILSRLDQRNVTETSAALRWARVQASRANTDEASFCEAAGALGLDPYQIDDGAAQSIEDAAALFQGEPLAEFLAGARGTNQRLLLQWVGDMKQRPRYQARIADLREIAVQIAGNVPARSDEAGWSLGYRRARSVRQVLSLQAGSRFPSYKLLAEKLNASSSFRLARDVDGIRVLREDHSDGVRLHVRKHGSSARARESELFSFCRAVGDVVCFPDECLAPVNNLHAAHRQAAGRAFAAEFLAPIDEVRSMQESGRDVVSMAEEFHVSTALIERQLENGARIDKSCV
jgi:hypothetical protein